MNLRKKSQVSKTTDEFISDKSLTSVVMEAFHSHWMDCCAFEEVDNVPPVIRVESFEEAEMRLRPERVFRNASQSGKDTNDPLIESQLLDDDGPPENNYKLCVLLSSGGEEAIVTGLKYIGSLNIAPLASAFTHFVQEQATLKTVDLTNCALTHEGIIMLRYILDSTSHITHLILDNNLIPAQSHGSVINEDSTLEHLSLRRCHITALGAKILANELKYNRKLKILDLSSNYIKSKGAMYIARALRWNRGLVYLSLADNKIDDEGAEELKKSLKMFTLTDKELKERQLLFNKLSSDPPQDEPSQEMTQAETILTDSEASEIIGSGSVAGGKSIIELAESTMTFSQRNKSDVVVADRKSSQNKGGKKKKVLNEDEIMLEMAKNKYAIMGETIETRTGYFCKGNHSLMYLNISYNKLSLVGAVHFRDVINYQISNGIKSSNQGLAMIVLQGNKFPIDHPVVEEIYQVITKIPESRKPKRAGKTPKRASKILKKSLH